MWISYESFFEMDGEMCQVYISFHYKLDKLKGTQNLGSLVSRVQGPQSLMPSLLAPSSTFVIFLEWPACFGEHGNTRWTIQHLKKLLLRTWSWFGWVYLSHKSKKNDAKVMHSWSVYCINQIVLTWQWSKCQIQGLLFLEMILAAWTSAWGSSRIMAWKWCGSYYV